MKKTKFLMLAFALLTFTMMGCSLLGGGEDSKEEEEKKKDIKYETFKGTVFKKVGTKKFQYSTNTLDVVEFGDWPQSIKEDNVKIDESKGAKAGAFTYFKGSDDAWYYKTKVKDYNTYETTTKWFKVEPIRWIIWKTDGNKSFMTTESILFGETFYDYQVKREIGGFEINPNNYDQSRIRAYLNGYDYQKKEKDDSELVTDNSFKDKGFLQTAFAENVSSPIAVTLVKNDKESAKNHQDTDRNNPYLTESNLNDKVFLVSASDVTTPDLDLIYLKPKAVDFALANNLQARNDGSVDWFLRTPYFAGYDSAETRSYVSSTILQATVNDKKGIVPAIWIQK